MANVSLHGVKKSYGEVPIIHGIDLDIPDGQFIVLVGPSGCGKSTLLRMIAGLEEISDGEIRIAGHVVNDVSPKDRNIAMVFQNYALYPHMTVAENMSFALRLAKRPQPEIDRRVGRAAAMLGLDGVLGRYPRALSGGQRQRVAMGRAIVREPQVFLFDEPLSNLDAKLRVQMRADIKSLHREVGTTSIYVTHDQIEAMTMADRIVVLRDGVVEQEGTPLEVYDRPANKFVAGFIGSPGMNFLPARLSHESGATVAHFDDGQRLALSDGPLGQPDQSVSIGLRPEHLRVATEEGIAVTIRVVETTGADTQLMCRCGELEMCAVVAERLTLVHGDTLRLVPRRDAIHVFDRDSGKRVG
jgi:multiple sugar transport system ATP-binding protein